MFQPLIANPYGVNEGSIGWSQTGSPTGAAWYNIGSEFYSDGSNVDEHH